MTSVLRIKPLHYIHVLDNNANITRVEVGPKTFTRQEHEQVVEGPTPMIMIPPRSYVVVSNPVLRGGDNKPVVDKNGNIRIKFNDEEIRFEQEPFPLYPGEKLVGKITPLTLLNTDSALLLRCVRDFKDGDLQRVAGDEWLFVGTTYYPRVEVKVVEQRTAIILKPNQALRLRAKKNAVDANKVTRKAGEEWIIKTTGSYLPGVDEEVVGVLNARVLTEKKALHLRALKTFTDVFGKKRKAGEEWLVTIRDAETHIPDVDEEVIGEVGITTLSNRQYCFILDPVDAKGVQHFGKRELRRGEVSFFLRPGERLEAGIQDIHILAEEESLLLRARYAFLDGKVQHPPGDLWTLKGPCEFVPTPEIEIVERRKAIALDENEGIYVRDRKTGKVRTVMGESYMLKPNEELWAKELPSFVEALLEKTSRESDNTNAGKKNASRDKTRVVTYRAPHNSAVQIYDYKERKSRIVFGPDLVLLGVNEDFTVISLSGGVPKQENKIKSLCLFMGPDFTTDVVIVETADHARLSLQLSYNWHFDVESLPVDQRDRIFNVPDFIGDACKAIASRVRGAVAGVSFDSFHKSSADIIKSAVFGMQDGKARERLVFNANNLVITNIDIQSVEPVDQRTKDSLQKSVQLAIEITTKSQEASAKRDAERAEQEAKGKLERQKLEDECKAEGSKKKLLELQAQSAIVESSGQAKAEAKARSDAALIEAQADVKQSELKAESTKISGDAELEQVKLLQDQEREHLAALNDLEIKRAKDLAVIEATKFKQIIDAIGADTIADIAQAGPQLQAKLLESLGLKSFLITDGNSPINLFNTASGLIGGQGGQ
eukprot:TRINITY_DN4298_c0_g1_i1.p1 TRINITY_DN4298_c0_g1~~TRINITY_DN4298_c0_g1_i1.p1  ORF type:complete len:862 (+),score=345.05 TRINITY_DN4298_c0_g1_i1:101-2587(+)